MQVIIQSNLFYTITKKYTLECVFVYNFVSPNVSLLMLLTCIVLFFLQRLFSGTC